jgi:hypothetical protein
MKVDLWIEVFQTTNVWDTKSDLLVIRLRLILHILLMPQVASSEGHADCTHAGANHREDSAS